MEQNDKILDVTGAELTPGKPDECQGNGEHPDFEICCDECDYYLDCFPDWEARLKAIAAGTAHLQEHELIEE